MKPAPRLRSNPRSNPRFTLSPRAIYLLGGGLALALELWARTHYIAGSHLLGQRLSEYHGNTALILLLAVLLARPLRLLKFRRAIGLLAFGFSVVHTTYAYKHVLGDTPLGFTFLTPDRQASVFVGLASVFCLLLLALTSSDWAVRTLRGNWKKLHRLGIFATLLAALHTVYMGVHFGFDPPSSATVMLLLAGIGSVIARARSLRSSVRRREKDGSLESSVSTNNE